MTEAEQPPETVTPEPDQSEQTTEQGWLVLSGEGVSALNDEHRILLGQMATALAGGKTVELTAFADRKSPAKRRVDPFDFTDKTLSEIVQIHDDIVGSDHDSPNSWAEELTDSFMWGMQDLCAAQPDLAADVIEVFATSAADGERRDTAAHLIGHLAMTKPEAALVLAETLLRDSEYDVLETVAGGIRSALMANSFTPYEALHLLRIRNTVDNDNIAVEDDGTNPDYSPGVQSPVEPPEKVR